MADARDRAEWNRTAWLCANIINSLNMNEDAEPATPADCNPYVLLERQKKAEAEGKRHQPSKNMPYNPAVLAARQAQYDQMTKGIS